MRLVKFFGVMLGAGLIWTALSALLRTMGFGSGATMVVGVLVLFIAGPVLFALATGSEASAKDGPLPDAATNVTKGPSRVAAAIDATHAAAAALESTGMGNRAAGLRESAAEAQSALLGERDPGGYSGEYRLLAKRTKAGGVVFWIGDAKSADDRDFLFKALITEAANLPEEFRQRFLSGKANPVRQTFECPGGGHELHLDLQ